MDVDARERIRDAAIARFGREGFGAGLRAIALDAQVSAALVIHHYGSKDALRAACDAHVHATIRRAKSEAMRDESPAQVIGQLATIEQYAPVFAYMVRSLMDGGPAAAQFVDGLVEDAESYLAAGVAAGTVRPSRDPHGRARALVASSVGTLLMTQLDAAAGRAVAPTDRPGEAIVAMAEATVLPGLELYTYGLFTDSSYLDAYLEGHP
ncbi:TetR/AcrR family transcriptional regulator [Cellulomonas rhizosphaerae]|uniref:TetR/AcrR family transcriptional regulator n=1 Tax=Cellulomonas rhizosphaerae TaxID=2293719 RepID=UPI0018F57AEF|nr:TetR family transcriptional regulator [Cellulomonas rhizosphaerae]